MKTIRRVCDRPIFQGDMMIVRVSTVPGDAKETDSNIVAHSETGHHHVVDRAQVFTTNDARTLFFKALGRSVDVRHLRTFDTHETIRLLSKPGDTFMVRRQREHTPEGWRMVAD